jgi:holo-[acyl-carrier protein] synthase
VEITGQSSCRPLPRRPVRSLIHGDPDSGPKLFLFSWGVKEAAYKALYPAVSPTWKELTYRGLDGEEGSRKPTLTYHPLLPYESKKVGRMHVSVSHDGDYVLTSVLVEGVKDG